VGQQAAAPDAIGLEVRLLKSVIRPRFKSHFHVRVFPPDTLILMHETGYERIDGRLYTLLAPWLDGARTVDEIISALGGAGRVQVNALDVHYGIGRLISAGFVQDAADPAPSGLAPLRDMLGVDPQAFRAALDAASVAIRDCIGLGAARFAAILKAFSIPVAAAATAPLTVFLIDHYFHPQLAGFNARALHENLAWMPVKPLGSVAFIGPVFRPGVGPCWACLERRLRENPEARILFGPGTPEGALEYSRVNLAPLSDSALSIAAIEILKWVVRPPPHQIENSILTLDTVAMKMEWHTVLRRPDCPVCGSPAPSRQLPSPLRLASTGTFFIANSGHRPSAPEAVYEKYRHHVSALTGIVHTLAPVESLAGGLVNVYAAGQNFCLDPARTPLPDQLGLSSWGKGMTPTEARTSALCEALERYSGIFRGDEIRRTALLDDLGELAVDPRQCMNFSPSQYRDRERWNTRGVSHNWIPAPFDPDRPIEWVPVWSLSAGVFKYAPAAFCYYNYPAAADHDFCRANSNGCAAGASLEDAFLQGFLELIERDAVAIWWYNRLSRPAVDLAAFSQPYFHALAEYYGRIGRRLWVLDVTADFFIPTFVAVSEGAATGRPDFILGSGAHFNSGVAIARALTEMNQALPVILDGGVRLTLAERSDDCFLRPSGSTVDHADLAWPVHEDLCDDVLACVEAARRRGIDVLVLDQTRPDVGLPVVRVIMSSMRHYWARLAPGRLYDVPVALGWLPAALDEEQMNPIDLAM
jgi:bacteriocin biosynthesis cyclodehydratase domain-containing protein